MSTATVYSTDYIKSNSLSPENNGPKRGYTNNPNFVRLVQHLQANNPEWKVEPLPENVNAKTVTQYQKSDGGIENSTVPDGTWITGEGE
jgi:hypothetical protein